MNEAALDRLRKLNLGLQTDSVNAHFRARVLINACIVEGINTEPAIVAALTGLGFDAYHIRKTLTAGIKFAPVWPEWGCRADGTYYAPERTSPTL
jgi:hypothetical protein